MSLYVRMETSPAMALLVLLVVRVNFGARDLLCMHILYIVILVATLVEFCIHYPVRGCYSSPRRFFVDYNISTSRALNVC